MQVSKLESSRRQLETVISMYFAEGDPVSMHTLTAAAYNVLRNINTKIGGNPMLIKDQLVNLAPSEYTKQVRDRINEAENFFKHADRDHQAILEFNPELTEYLIMDACDKYREIAGEYPHLMAIFRAWMMMTNQDIFNLTVDQLTLLSKSSNELVIGGKAEYFRDMLAALLLST